MPVSPFKDRFGKALALTGSASGSSPPSVGVSSSFKILNTAAGGMKTAKIDIYRQGVSITSRRYIRRDSPSTVNVSGQTATIGSLPVLTSNGMDGETLEEIHAIEVRDFGQPKLFVDHEPFEDMASMKIHTRISSDITSAYGGAIAYLNDTNQQLYPVILSNVSMKYPDQMDGVIEPFPIREVISNRSAETPFVAHRVRADILDGNIEESYGSDRVTQIMSVTASQQIDPFIDSAEIAMADGGTFTLFAPGFTSDLQRILPPFLDRGSPGAEGKERFCKILVGTGSLRDLGLIDSHHKSAGSGFTYGNNPEGTDSLAFGGLLCTGSTSMSRFLSKPPRLELRESDSRTGSYPTINRTGDRSRAGKYSVNFDDRKTVIFTSASAVYPQVLNFDSPNFIFPTSSLGKVTRNLRKGVSDIRVEFTPGEALGPYDDSLISLGSSSFYMTGTTTDIMDGFSGPLKSKTQIFFDVTPSETLTLTRLPNDRFSILDSGASSTKTGFAYWNSASRRWEQIGLKDPATGADIKFDYAAEGSAINNVTSGTNTYPQQFTPCQHTTFTKGQIIGKPFNGVLRSRLYHLIGSPTVSSFAPFKTTYHATSSQTISMSDYISHPFLLEKIVVKMEGRAQRVHPRAKEGAAIRHQDDYMFFIYRQERRNPSGSFRGGGPDDNSPGTPTPSNFFRVDSATDISGSQRFLVCSGAMTFYQGTVATTDAGSNRVTYDYKPVNSPAFSYDFNILAAGATQRVGAFTGSIKLEIEPAVATQGIKGRSVIFDSDSPNAATRGAGIYHYWPGGTTSKPFMHGGHRVNITDSYDMVKPSIYTGKAGIDASYGQWTFTQITNGTVPKSSLGPRQLPITEIDSRTFRPLGGPIGDPIEFGNNTNAAKGMAPRRDANQSAKSPYILFPEDKIVFGLEAAIAPGDISSMTGSGNAGGGFGGQNSLTGSKLEIFQSDSRQTIVFYGSLIRDGKEHHDTLNQPLTSDAIHEMIFEPVVDQWDISSEAVNAGTYADNYVTGTMTSAPYPHNADADEFSNNLNSVVRGVAGSFIKGTAPNRAGSFQRSVTMFDSSQRFYDTIMPDLKTYVRRSGGFQELQASGSMSTIVFNPTKFYIEGDGHRMPFPYDGNPTRNISDSTNLLVISAAGSSYLYGSSQSSLIRRLLFMIGFEGGTFDTYTTFTGKTGATTTTIASFAHAHPQSTGAMGYRYGIQNIYPENPRAVFRRDSYGQFRDMLEQRKEGRFFEPFLSDIDNLNLRGKSESTVGDPAVFCKFTKPSSDESEDPYLTTCSNMSFASTSSLPFFDGEIVNITNPTLLKTVAVVKGTTLPAAVQTALQTPGINSKKG